MKKHSIAWLALTLARSAQASAATAETPTFNQEVVRIFQHDCQTCHRPGGLAPFSLMEYKDALAHARKIDESIRSGSMPPWKPVAGCGDFEGNRSLSAEDIDTIHRWATAGAPEGNPSEFPPEKKFPSTWQLGPPDAALSSPKPYPVGASDEDEYRCFVLPFTAAKDDFLVGVEVRPDQSSVVHHAILYLDPKGESPALLNPADPKPGYECFGGPGYRDAIGVGGWVPGNFPAFLPEGMGFAVPKGSHLVVQIHYHQDGKNHLDQTQIGLHFAKKPITKPMQTGYLYDATNLHIPAGNPQYTIAAEKVLDKDIKLINVTPHMHLLGHKIGLEAVLPDNTTRCLVQINDWDFHWQGTYTYKKFIDLPKGTRLRLKGEYNNSESNPDQFYHPPRDVSWGERTVDEMFLSFFGYVLK